MNSIDFIIYNHILKKYLNSIWEPYSQGIIHGIPELSGRWRVQVAGSGETAWKPMRKSRLSRPRN